MTTDSEIVNLINKDFTYPNINDENLQTKIYDKREFHYYRIPEQLEPNNVTEIQNYRNEKCSGNIVLQEHQHLLNNFINPNTPYKGLLIFHGVGTGKCVLGDTLVNVNNEQIKISDLWDTTHEKINTPTVFEEWKTLTQIKFTNSFIMNKLQIEMKNCKILKLFRQYVQEPIRKIILKSGKTITSTFQHKFYSKNSWTNKLSIGSKILVYDNKNIKYEEIINIYSFMYSGYVYDLEIDTHHNYLANNIITHNTCAAISIAEKFKEQVLRYNTKIHVLLPGPLLKEQWKRELINCTNNTYLNIDNLADNSFTNSMQNKSALNDALQYYKFISYKGFYKRVLGEKIFIKTNTKKSKNNFERDISTNRINNLNNTLIIVEEAHNLTGNEYGEALQYIIDNSVNLKILLLTATPMKNLGDDIIDLINFLRPKNSKLLRDKIFTNEKNHEMKIRSGGIEYLKKMTHGYISYLKGGNILTYATKIDMGEIPDFLKFTYIIRCKMLDYQLSTYNTIIETLQNEGLDRKSEAAANFVFPGIDDKRNLIGFFGIDGYNKLIGQLKINSDLINQKICDLLQIKKNSNMIYLVNNEKNIAGDIFKQQYLQFFSVKFYQCLNNINKLVVKQDGPRTAFIYSNLVKIGIEIFQIVLLSNGYLEYDEHQNYQIQDDTRCYFCGIINNKHNNIDHEFKPATFLIVTGKSDNGENIIPEEKQKIINDVFNNIENKTGKFIKFILGSKVMNEGITLKNIGQIHILDVYYNLGRIDQVVGRGIRHCSHYALMIEGDTYPEVKVFKYCVALQDSTKISSEELLYKKAEFKYILVKQVERSLKEIAIDCPLNMAINVNKQIINKYKNCQKNNTCPEICDFTDCNYQCNDKLLNLKYYDPERYIYRQLKKNELDYSTFIGSLAKGEIDNIKLIIKRLFKIRHIYHINDIIKYIKLTYDKHKLDFYDDFFVFKALDELIPITQNDMNNFKDYIKDKYNILGFIIAIRDNFIFQPINQPRNLSIYYRTIYDKSLSTHISISNYIHDKYKINNIDDINNSDVSQTESLQKYDLDYYNNKTEFNVIGIIEKYKGRDNFKLRDKRNKILGKKRAIGIQSLTGAVCLTRDKKYVKQIAKKLDITIDKQKRTNLCQQIADKLLFLEKYAKGANKLTYMMIPQNHAIYPFPYNLEDRIEFIRNKILDIDKNILIKTKTSPDKKNYELQVSHVPKNKENIFIEQLKQYSPVLHDLNYIFKID